MLCRIGHCLSGSQIIFPTTIDCLFWSVSYFFRRWQFLHWHIGPHPPAIPSTPPPSVSLTTAGILPTCLWCLSVLEPPSRTWSHHWSRGPLYQAAPPSLQDTSPRSPPLCRSRREHFFFPYIPPQSHQWLGAILKGAYFLTLVSLQNASSRLFFVSS